MCRVLKRGVLAVVLATLVASPAWAQKVWQPTGSLNVARFDHSMALLASGKVLAAGGHNGVAVIGNAEIFDPATGKWTTTKSVPTVARGHLIMVSTGKLLAVGDAPHSGSHPHPAFAYLYNEAAGTWTATANRPVHRVFWASLTPLASGKLLYAGGYNGHGRTSSFRTAELYDPKTNRWTATGSMAALRRGQFAARLTRGPNAGKVLVAGGATGSGVGTTLRTAELYDPAKGTWSAAASMRTARAFGASAVLPSGDVFVVGGNAGTAAYATTEIYRVAAGTWVAGPSMAAARWLFTLTPMGAGKWIAAAGRTNPSTATPLASTEIYDAATNKWGAGPKLPASLNRHAAVRLRSGGVLLAGGRLSSNRATGAALVLGDLVIDVTLLRLSATRDAAGVRLNWETAAETNCGAFQVLRCEGSTCAAGEHQVLADVGAVPCRDRAGGARYGAVDATAKADRAYSYVLREIEGTGGHNDYGPVVLAGDQTHASWRPVREKTPAAPSVNGCSTAATDGGAPLVLLLGLGLVGLARRRLRASEPSSDR